MAFQTPVTVEDVLGAIHQKQYLLPAIQREFVWGPDQIRRLVDSLLRGYPIGSFLLWRVEPETASAYAFYDFLTDYHERDRPYASKATVLPGQGTTAVLDGQQRLTALNIALYGSHAEKKKYAWWSSPDAFPRKRLYLNLLDDPDRDDLGLRYDLRFLTKAEAAPDQAGVRKWFRVGHVLSLSDAGPALMRELAGRGLDLNNVAIHQRLYSLYEAVRTLKPINWFLETSQDSDKVLDIFVRVNSGGTTLSYSDLLLSMATNQWQQLDAREEVRNLVHELNTGGSRQFEFSKDVVLKTALMIAGVDLRFSVSNFTQANMTKVENTWEDTRLALINAASLLQAFGYSGRTLTADSVVVPLAHYLARRQLTDAYITSSAHATDRQVVRSWVTRSLVKRGIWGSGLDTVLGRLRQIVDSDGADGFPIAAIEAEMTAIGKTLAFDPAEVDALLEMKYGGQRTFATLSLLYPGLDTSKAFHQDHVYPRSRFTPKRLRAAGVPDEDIDAFREAVDRLPNLQLLPSTPNIEKQSTLPVDWLEIAYPNSVARDHYIAENDLEALVPGVSEFMTFYEDRKASMRRRLETVLGVSP